MRQKHRQATESTPLRLARTNKLIDENLRTVGEITELPFPYDKSIGFGARVTVFETEYGLF